ncbi:MAG: hypothetical protein H0W73_11380 [Bacteroidetes bacterium]|nr:hypothetical protein [Bacteroidota bacterium]
MKPIKQGKNSQENELTPETLKQYEGFENITEAQATKQIDTIKRLAKILYYSYMYELEKQKAENNFNTEPL